MPEGPELHLSSQFINSVCKGLVFSGNVRKNPIHKCEDVPWNVAAYTISALSRGKELKLFLKTLKTEKDGLEKDLAQGDDSQAMQILFNFGMSGKFEFTSSKDLPKHAHLSFFTGKEDEGDRSMALSFVDARRFGKWRIGAEWSPDRGPCVMFEYPQFRSNILNNLNDTAFNKPLCEVLLNQKYFNGIGNYLRAEICYRGGVRPFDEARSVFASLQAPAEDVTIKDEKGAKVTAGIKSEKEGTDVLMLCNTIPHEVIKLGTTLYLPEDENSDMSKFSQWLQCYYKPGMKNVADHNKRTMWFHGDPGPMIPKENGSKKRLGVYSKKLATNSKKLKQDLETATEDEGGEKDCMKLQSPNPTSDPRTAKKQKKSQQSQGHSKQRKSEQSQGHSRSPIKTRRATRTFIDSLPDKATKNTTPKTKTENRMKPETEKQKSSTEHASKKTSAQTKTEKRIKPGKPKSAPQSKKADDKGVDHSGFSKKNKTKLDLLTGNSQNKNNQAARVNRATRRGVRRVVTSITASGDEF